MGAIGDKKLIRFKVLPVGEDDANAAREVILKKSLGMGSMVQRLEEEFADYIGCKHAVAVGSCTNSLFLTLQNKNVQTVAIPSMMVPLVANEIIHSNMTPYFTTDTEWVGHAYEMIGTDVIDSAHEVIPNKWDFDLYTVCYSFYPTKPIGGADGGMICTNDDSMAKWYKQARSFGRDSGDTIVKNSWEYGIEFPGWRMYMNDVQAAIAYTQLKRHPEINLRMTEIREKYNGIFGLHNTSNYLYRIEADSRDEFIKYMYRNGIECGVHFYPLHMMDAFRRYPGDDMTEVEIAYRRTVSLPFHIYLTDEEIRYISDKALEWEQHGMAYA